MSRPSAFAPVKRAAVGTGGSGSRMGGRVSITARCSVRLIDWLRAAIFPLRDLLPDPGAKTADLAHMILAPFGNIPARPSSGAGTVPRG